MSKRKLTFSLTCRFPRGAVCLFFFYSDGIDGVEENVLVFFCFCFKQSIRLKLHNPKIRHVVGTDCRIDVSGGLTEEGRIRENRPARCFQGEVGVESDTGMGRNGRSRVLRWPQRAGSRGDL